MKTILVTGSAGFMGRNLTEYLRRKKDITLLRFDMTDTDETLSDHLKAADVVFHLAGVNRPLQEEDFVTGNAGLTMRIVARLLERRIKPLLVFSSSIQAALDNPYGRSKRQAEAALEEYGALGGPAVIARLANVFGKWSRPNYNSAVATFCHNIARGLEITISDPERIMELVYIDDVMAAFDALLEEPEPVPGVRRVNIGPVTTITLGALVKELYQMRDIRDGLLLPDLQDRFRRSLYATYVSFLPEDDFSYDLLKREDQRGALAELLKSPHFGQLFISRTHPGFVRGNHFHHTKVEKFCVLEGEALIRFRHISNGNVLTYPVSGTEFRVVDIPPGYTHSIENVGERELVVLFWSSELFDLNAADTYPLAVAITTEDP
ncbi:MAG TPA: NAD-dependent epimerase/dehydratase family protein [Bacteroidota bacterium]|nr:NAD-dependent epimerase/dehydratase family protein [Bacteroidota bacterium]